MPRVRDLPPAEFQIMDALWRKGEATVKEVREALNDGTKRAYTTVATLLSRLREKGFVEAEERNFAYVFRPLVQREKVVRGKLDDLVDRILGGDVSPLAVYIAERRKLTPEQLAALQEMVRSSPEKEVE